jgi:hypothetical protein
MEKETANPAINYSQLLAVHALQTMATGVQTIDNGTLEAEAVPRKKRGRPSTAEKEKGAALEAVRSDVAEKGLMAADKIITAKEKTMMMEFAKLKEAMTVSQAEDFTATLGKLKVSADGHCTDNKTKWINNWDQYKRERDQKEKKDVHQIEIFVTSNAHKRRRLAAHIQEAQAQAQLKLAQDQAQVQAQLKEDAASAFAELHKLEKAELDEIRCSQIDETHKMEEKLLNDGFKDGLKQLESKLQLSHAEAYSNIEW